MPKHFIHCEEREEEESWRERERERVRERPRKESAERGPTPKVVMPVVAELEMMDTEDIA